MSGSGGLEGARLSRHCHDPDPTEGLGVKEQRLRVQGHDSWVARDPLFVKPLSLQVCPSTLRSMCAHHAGLEGVRVSTCVHTQPGAGPANGCHVGDLATTRPFTV